MKLAVAKYTGSSLDIRLNVLTIKLAAAGVRGGRRSLKYGTLEGDRATRFAPLNVPGITHISKPF